jgi:RND family efflux transporter MFP subunit
MRIGIAVLIAIALCLGACSRSVPVRAGNVDESQNVVTVGVTPVTRKAIGRKLTVSSELVPYQETDVFAKESGYVKELLVDYGSRVSKDQLMAVLEIPELEAQLKQDDAAIANANEAVISAQHEVDRLEAQRAPVHAQAERLAGVAKTRAGLVAQQEVDDAQGKDMALAAQVEAGKSGLQAARSQMDEAKARRERDQVLFGYARITAPFAGVVTQRYANLGALMQAGTTSSTQAMPLVRLSQDDVFRLVIPVPESYVKYIRIGDSAQVRVPTLDRVFAGTVKRFSANVSDDTRTMHTEVELLNPAHVLMPGLYAEATLTLDRKNDALVLPLQAVIRANGQATVFVVDNNNTLEERTIAVGIETANDIEVLSGLNQGDRVVVSDRSALKTGMRVKAQTVEVGQYPAAQQ